MSPLLPYSQLVYDMLRVYPGVYDSVYRMRWIGMGAQMERVREIFCAVVRNHPVFEADYSETGHRPGTLDNPLVSPFHSIELTLDGADLIVECHINRILGDGEAPFIFAEDFHRVWQGVPMTTDKYWEYLQYVEQQKQTPRYLQHKEALEKEFADYAFPVRPHTDLEINAEVVPMAGELLADYADLAEPLRAMQEREHLTTTAFFSLCASMAIMDYEQTDEAALTWAYRGRDREAEQYIVGSLHRDIPMRISRAETREDYLRQARNRTRQGIVRSDYPLTLTVPHSEIWNYAVNVLEQPNIMSIAEMFPFPIEPIYPEQDALSPAYALLDINIEGAKLRFAYSATHYKEDSIRRFATLIRKNAEWLLSN